METIIQQFQALDTTSVSDALDRLGLKGGLYRIKPIKAQNGRVVCGRAFTVHYLPCGQIKGTVGDFLDDVAEGQVVVIDNGGRDYCTVWGDIMTVVAQRNKVAATVIDGVCRDVAEILKLDYPMFSKGYYMVTGKDRVEVDAVNIPVSISGVQVCPGDLIMGDDSGALVIPRAMEEKVLEVAKEIADTENRIVEEIKKGASLKESRVKLNYHHLQTKA